MSNKLIVKYNQPGNILIISSYPGKGETYSRNVCAVAGFAKNSVQALLESFGKDRVQKKVIVLTTKIGKKEELYEEKDVLVHRVIERNHPLSYLTLIKDLFRFGQINNVLIEFEFGSFGDVKTTASFLPVLLLIKMLQKKRTIVLHQVIENLGDINGHLGWDKNDLRGLIFNPGITLFYKIIGFFADRIVVTEEVFRQKLEKIIGKNVKIECIPHGIDTAVKTYSKEQARKALKLPLNKKIVLYFGYLSWYKGPDVLLDFAKKSTDNTLLFLIAGGKSFTNSDKSHYRSYLAQFDNPPKNLVVTGFVPENKIGLYYSAADVVILPYRTMMSSSGPLSLAFSFQKPVILSENLLPYVKSRDFKYNLNKAGLSKNDLFFRLNTKDFNRKIQRLKIDKLTAFSSFMRNSRSYSLLSSKLAKTITDNTPSVVVNRGYQLRKLLWTK